jgi:hypothetical protein
MKLLLCITIGPAIPVSYANAIAEQISMRLPDVVAYDCDNHSEALVVRYAINLLKEAAKAAVVIRGTDSGPGAQEPVLGNVRRLLENLLQKAADVRVFWEGTHLLAERMIGLLPAGKVLKGLTLPEQVHEIELFLGSEDL